MISPEYAAGFFDGEGCVSITRSWKNGQVHLSANLVNTNKQILDLFKLQFGGNVHTRQLKPNWKPASHWFIYGYAAIEFFKFIRPFLRIKQSQVELAFEFWNFMSLPKEERCVLVARESRVFNPTVPGKFMIPHTWSRKPETIIKESEFKNRMHILNKKGVPCA